MTSILMAMSVLVLVYTVVEKPWKESEINYLAMINEVMLYSLLVTLLLAINIDDAERKLTVGWIMIFIFTISLQINLAVVFAKSCQHVSLLYTRFKNKKAFLEKRRKIAPLNLQKVDDLECQSPSSDQPKKDRSVILPEIKEESAIKEEESASMQ